MCRLIGALLFGFVVACGSSGGSVGTDGGGGGDDQPGDDGGGTTGPRTVKLTLTNKPTNADTFSFIVAYQDGAGPWKVAPAPSGDTYSFTINAPSYGVAFTCIGAAAGTTATQIRSVTAASFAVGERTEVTLDVPPRCSDRQTMGNIMLNGSVTNRPFGGTLVVAWGGRTAIVGGQTGNFQLSAPAGTHDLFVVHAMPEGNGDFYTDSVWIARDVTLSGNSNRNINFAEAQSTTQYYVDTGTVIDLGARITATTTLYTANGTSGQLVRENANWEVQSLADAQMRSSDVYDLSIQVANLGKSATVTKATNAPADIEWMAPPPLGAVQSMVAAKQPYVILQATWPAYADAVGYTWNATQQLTGTQCGGNTNAACTVTWQAYLSPGVTGAMPGFRMPELAALPGWKKELELVSGAAIVGSVTAHTSSAGAHDFPGGVPANGTVRTFIRTDYSTTP